MKVSVQFPLKTSSENEMRSLPMVVANVARRHGARRAQGVAQGIAARVKKQRAYVRSVLDSQFPRLRRTVSRPDTPKCVRHVHDQEPNFYRVTLVRISAGTLDDDGVRGALKAVRDEVAAWLGIDDGPRAPASWRYGQQRGPQKTYAVRVEIEDDDPRSAEDLGRPSAIIVGAPIATLGPVVGDVQHAPRGTEAPRWPLGLVGATSGQRGGTVAQVARGLGMTEKALRMLAPGKCRLLDRSDKRAAVQARLVFRRSYYAPAGQDACAHCGHGRDDHQGPLDEDCIVCSCIKWIEPDELLLEELTGPLFEREEPPQRIIKAGRELVRSEDVHPELGVHWMYVPAGSRRRAGDEERERNDG